MSTEQPEHILQFFAFEHLPPVLRDVSEMFSVLAHVVVNTLPRNPESLRTENTELLTGYGGTNIRGRRGETPAMKLHSRRHSLDAAMKFSCNACHYATAARPGIPRFCKERLFHKFSKINGL